MSNFLLSPNMNLPIPIPGTEPGPQYANDLNSSLTLVDGHDHSPGFGVLINPDGLDISTDLPMNQNNLILTRSVRFFPETAPLNLVTDLSCLYAVTEIGSNGDLWYNDASGNPIQITKTGAVLATISALISGTNEASFVANQLVVNAVQSTGTPANVMMASVLLGNNSPGTNFLTLQPPNAMPSSYNVVLPAPNSIGQTAILTYDTSNNILASTPASTIINGTSPTGSVTMFAGTTIPASWLLCDGTSYLRTSFPALFAAIGTAYGAADGTHFNVPDMRGMFPRGVTGASSNDPDASSRTAQNIGGATGNNVGSQQTDAITGHTHNVSIYTGGGNIAGNPAEAGSVASSIAVMSDPVSLTGNSIQSTENRPINVYFNFIIKT